jgi:hypothetical protein
MRILTRNLLEEADTLIMTNPNADYPIEQIYSNMLEEIVLATDITTTITATYTSDQIVDCIFYGYLNFYSIVVILRDATDDVIEIVYQNWPEQRGKLYTTQQRINVRKIEIRLFNSGSNVFIGNVAIGAYTQLYNVRMPIHIGYKITGKFEQTNGGQLLNRKGIRLANFDIFLSKNTDKQHDTFFDSFDRVMLGKTFWLDRNEDVSSRLPIFGAFDTEPSTDENNQFIDIFASFLEGR